MIQVWFIEFGQNESSRSALKIGHGGTLDCDASGVLPIGLGSGCKQLHQLLQSDKVFQSVFNFF